MSPITEIGGLLPTSVWQIGFVVNDLEESLREWSARTDGGIWVVYAYSHETIPLLEYEGRPAQMSYQLAMSQSLIPQIELIQPVQGPSVYDPWVSIHGPGVHHLGYRVANLDEAIERMERHGYRPVQKGAKYGADQDGGFAYFDLRASLGTFIELIEIPGRRRRPDAIWMGGGFYHAVPGK